MNVVYIDSMYCLACHTVQQKQHKHILFTSGYYRVGIPIGCCVTCSSNPIIFEQFKTLGGADVTAVRA